MSAADRMSDTTTTEVLEQQAPIQDEDHSAVAAVAPSSKDTPFEEETTKGGSDAEEDDENETCGFCIFMKGGGCKEAFTAWSGCVDKEREAGGDFTEECKEATLKLRECMLAHREYYAPLLEEEEAEMEAARQAAEAAAASGRAEEIPSADTDTPAP